MKELWLLSLTGAAMDAQAWQEEYDSSRFLLTWDLAEKSYLKAFFFLSFSLSLLIHLHIYVGNGQGLQMSFSRHGLHSIK